MLLICLVYVLSLSVSNSADEKPAESCKHAIRLSGLKIDQPKLPNCPLTRARWGNLVLIKPDLSGITLDEASIIDVIMNETTGAKASFLGTQVSKVLWNESNFAGATFRAAHLKVVSLKNSNLSNADFRASYLFKVNFSGADLSGANFKNAVLWDCIWENVKIDKNTVLPEGVKISNRIPLFSVIAKTPSKRK